ncbi:MAG: ZIP family metal transporter [Christensenellales bacterium]
MTIVLLTALGVGGATIIGALLGLIFKNISHKFSDIVLAFASGIMLAAAVLGLILPSLEHGGKYGILITLGGIFAGAICLNLMDKFIPHMHNEDLDADHEQTTRRKVMLFVLAIAIHNLPEGIAAGVGFGTGDHTQALMIAGGIALQNIPEGMIVIGPMLACGIDKKKSFFYAFLTGVVEIVGTLIGYFAVSIATAVLPFALAFAGGTMLYVVSDEMIPETHSHGHERGATYALLIGFGIMLIADTLLG